MRYPLGRPDWVTAKVQVVLGTIFCLPASRRRTSWESETYRTPHEAFNCGVRQLDYYRRLSDEVGGFSLIRTLTNLDEVLRSWKNYTEPAPLLENDPYADEFEPPSDSRLIGIMPLMKGCDPILEPAQAEEWVDAYGVRIFALSYEKTRYAGSALEPGGITFPGYLLLETLGDLGAALDISGLTETTAFEVLERYSGQVLVSSAALRRFAPDNGWGLSDRMIESIGERNGVIGLSAYNGFLKRGWQSGDLKELVTLYDLADAVDHICQITGSAEHAALGTNFDGGFGFESIPSELTTTADLPLLAIRLVERGYGMQEIEAILGGNWHRILRSLLPSA